MFAETFFFETLFLYFYQILLMWMNTKHFRILIKQINSFLRIIFVGYKNVYHFSTSEIKIFKISFYGMKY